MVEGRTTVTRQIAKAYRYRTTDAGNVLSSLDQNNNPLQVTLNDSEIGSSSGAAIRRNFDNQIMLPATTALITATAPGVWEYDHTYLNLDPAFEYTLYFRFHDAAVNDNDVESVLIAGNTDEDSRANLRRRVGHLMFGRDRFQWGPVIAADGVSVSANFVRRTDDGWLKGRNLFIVSGPGSGQEAFITESSRGNAKMTVSPAWSTLPTVSSTVEVWGDRLSVEDVNANINLAILDAAQIKHVRMTAEITTFNEDSYSFTLPAEFTYVYRVRYRSATQHKSYDLTRHGEQYNYDIRNGEVFLNTPIPSDITSLFVDGYRKPVLLHDDSDISDIPSAFVTYMAAFYCEGAQAGGQSIDPEQHSGRAGNWLRQALLVRSELNTKWLPNTYPVEV